MVSQTVSTVFLNRLHFDNKHRTSFHMIYDNLFYHTSFYENRLTSASLANPKAFDIIFPKFAFEFAYSEVANG